MAKITQCVVIEFSLLKDIISALNSADLQAWSEVLIEDYKDLTPIIKDAFHAENTWNVDFNEYLNETEL